MTTDQPSLADQLNGNGASRNANRPRWLGTTPFRRSSVSPVGAAGGISRRGRAPGPWRWSWNRLSPYASSNFRHMLTLINRFNNVVNCSCAFRAPSPGTHSEVLRRASLGVFGAIALACASAPGGAFALTRAVGGIHVDVAPLRENAGDPTAAWVAQAMPRALAQALAEAGRPRGPVSIRIDYVILGPNSGNAGGPAGSSPDQMVGVVIVAGVARPLRAQTWYYPAASQSNYDRVFQLSRAFAYWAARGYSGT